MKNKSKPTRIMVFGTFDVLHKGHFNFFSQAKKLAKNPFLIVSVARDLNVKKIKGKKPVLSEQKRLALVKKVSIVNKAVLGGLKAYLPHIASHKPDIIALGYDQKSYTQNLKILLGKLNLKVKIVRLKPYKAHLYKSSFYQHKLT